MPTPFDNPLVLALFAMAAWLAVVAIVTAACRAAGRFDELASQPFPPEHVADGPQQDLHVAP